MRRQVHLNLLMATVILTGVALQALLGFPIPRDVRNWWCAERYRRECLSNIRHLATACECYSTDNAGHYPASLRQLAPSALPTLPTCPTVGTFTYTATQPIDIWPGYTITCTGDHGSRRVEAFLTQTMVAQ